MQVAPAGSAKPALQVVDALTIEKFVPMLNDTEFKTTVGLPAGLESVTVWLLLLPILVVGKLSEVEDKLSAPEGVGVGVGVLVAVGVEVRVGVGALGVGVGVLVRVGVLVPVGVGVEVLVGVAALGVGVGVLVGVGVVVAVGVGVNVGPPVMALAKALMSTVPHPVTSSYPELALYPVTPL